MDKAKNIVEKFNKKINEDSLGWSWNPNKIMAFINLQNTSGFDVFNKPKSSIYPEHVVIHYPDSSQSQASFYFFKDGNAIMPTILNKVYTDWEESNIPYSSSNSLEEMIIKFLKNPKDYTGSFS